LKEVSRIQGLLGVYFLALLVQTSEEELGYAEACWAIRIRNEDVFNALRPSANTRMAMPGVPAT
jgi:hypothetical protein